MKNIQSIIITGGLGFVGFHLTKKLISLNFLPIIIDDLSNSNQRRLQEISNEIYFIESDIQNENFIYSKIIRKKLNPETIIHLAAKHFIPFCVKNPEVTFENNVDGTKAVLELSQKLGVKNILFASSAAVYKPSLQKHKEKDKIDAIDIYAETKIIGEKMIKSYANKFKLNYTIFRLFNIYGPGDLTPHFIPSLIERIKNDHTIEVGNLDTFRDYIYVEDVVEAFRKVILNKKKLKNSIYNVGSGIGTSGYEIINILQKILNKKFNVQKTKSLFRNTDRNKLIADINKIKRELSWTPKILINKGLKNLINVSYDK